MPEVDGGELVERLDMLVEDQGKGEGVEKGHVELEEKRVEREKGTGASTFGEGVRAREEGKRGSGEVEVRTEKGSTKVGGCLCVASDWSSTTLWAQGGKLLRHTRFTRRF